MGDHSDKEIFYEPIDHRAFSEKYPYFETEPILSDMLDGEAGNPCAHCGVDLRDHGTSINSMDCIGWAPPYNMTKAYKAYYKTDRKLKRKLRLISTVIYSLCFIVGADILLIIRHATTGPLGTTLLYTALGIAVGALAFLTVAVPLALQRRRKRRR